MNDVASVNIDAKLISSEANNVDSYNAGGGVVELQNGCACCSLADELFTSIMTLTKGGERELDAIVVELRYVYRCNRYVYMRYVYEVYLLLTYATKFPNSNKYIQRRSRSHGSQR